MISVAYRGTGAGMLVVDPVVMELVKNPQNLTIVLAAVRDSAKLNVYVT